jgi:sec-independent protein translocase protein TatA
MFLAAGPFGLGPMELVIILLVLVMLFGATRLADIGGSLGKGIKEFRKNIKETGEEEEESAAPTAAASTPSSTNGAETVSAVKCPSCGSLNPVGARHCNQCGASIAATVS